MFPDNIVAEIERKASAAQCKAHKKGLQEGRQEGETMALLCLLERCFGIVPAEIGERIASADLARIGQ